MMKRRPYVYFITVILALMLASCAVGAPADVTEEPPPPTADGPSPVPSPVPTPAPPPEPSEDPPLIRDPYSITYTRSIAGNEYTVIENELIRIYLPADAEIPPDIEEMIMRCVVWVEEAAGSDYLSKWTNRNIYISTEKELEEWFSGMDEMNRKMNAPWRDNTNHEAENIRLGVYLFDEMIGMADPTGIYIGLDYLQDPPGSYDSIGVGVIIHELAHVDFLRAMEGFGGWFWNRPLSEGHAEWITVKAAREQGLQTVLDHWTGQLRLSHIDGIEDYFTTGWVADDREEPWTYRPYQYGYAFLSFLDEVYGTDVIRSMYKKIDGASYMNPTDANCDDAWAETRAHNSRIKVEIIKNATSDSVFDDCIAWFAENRDKIYN